MKIGTYVLNLDGSVPEYVLGGGYFAAPNDLPSPQDWTLVGMVSADAPIETFASFTDFITYLEGIGAESWVDNEGLVFNYVLLATAMWDEESLSWIETTP